LELKAIQHEFGITFVHVTHDQEEAMTMADQIAVMNGGRIEQLGAPSDLYERPATAFVAGFLGVSNLLYGTVAGADTVRLDGGGELRVAARALGGRSGRIALGVRPEKIRLGTSEPNRLEGRVIERAYVGVATQYVLQTDHGSIQVYVQNLEPGVQDGQAGASMTVSFSPDVVFVVDATSPEEDE